MTSIKPALCLSVALLLLSAAAAISELKLQRGFAATSGISVVNHKKTTHLLFRDAGFGLAHVVVGSDGKVMRSFKLGGVLLSGVSACETRLFGTSLSLDVVYLTKLNRVAMRLLRNGKWGPEIILRLPFRTVDVPSIAPAVTQDGTVELYATALSKNVAMVKTKNGAIIKSKPTWFMGMKVTGGPTALNTYLPRTEGIQLYVRDAVTGALFVSSSAKNAQKFSPVKHMGAGLHSDVCAASIGEGGQIVIGTSAVSTAKGVARFKHLDFAYPKTGQFGKNTYITEKPGCGYWGDSCTLLVMNHGAKILYDLYCN